jgi:ankyrin repeat protein
LLLSACALWLALAGCHNDSTSPEQAASALPPAGQMAGSDATVAPSPLPDAALIKSIEKGDLKAVRSLVDQGANPNATEPVLARTPLHSAAFFGRDRIADFLIERGANVKARDSMGLTPLHAAVLAGDKGMASRLLAKGADIDAATDAGATPLHMAAAVGEYEVAKLLVHDGADARRLDKNGQAPRFYATRNGHAQTAGLLPKVDGKD